MGMSTQRKVCGALLALAVSAFGVDRWILGPGPSKAQADQTTAAAVSPAGGASAPAAPRAGAGLPTTGARLASDKPGRSLASRLQEATASERLDLTVVPDAFHARPSGLPPRRPRRSHRLCAPVGATSDPVADFRSRHKLTAIIKSDVPGGGLAMIDGRTVVPGETPDWLDGFEMVWVREGAHLLPQWEDRGGVEAGRDQAEEGHGRAVASKCFAHRRESAPRGRSLSALPGRFGCQCASRGAARRRSARHPPRAFPTPPISDTPRAGALTRGIPTS